MSQPSRPPIRQLTLADLIDFRLNRRGLIRGTAPGSAVSPFSVATEEAGLSSPIFKELAHTVEERQLVAEGYDAPWPA